MSGHEFLEAEQVLQEILLPRLDFPEQEQVFLRVESQRLHLDGVDQLGYLCSLLTKVLARCRAEELADLPIELTSPLSPK